MSLLEPDKCINFKLSKSQINQWRNHGYLIVNNIIEPDLLNNAFTDIHTIFPNVSKKEIDELSKVTDFGSNGKLEFPSQYNSLNKITLSENLINAVSDLLNDKDIRLIQSDAWAKYGTTFNNGKLNNRDQRMHFDYPNNNLVHPPEWDNPESVAMIIYYDDYSEGSTALVPRRGLDDEAYQWPYINLPGVSGHPWINNKDDAEDYFRKNYPEKYEFRKKLYQREKKINYSVGTVLFYRLDLWHRGTPVKPGKIRRVHNLGFKKASSEWITTWNKGWARKLAFKGNVEPLYAKLSVLQRNCLGFPKPGDPYWTEKTLNAFIERYKQYGLDASPYLRAKL